MLLVISDLLTGEIDMGKFPHYERIFAFICDFDMRTCPRVRDSSRHDSLKCISCDCSNPNDCFHLSEYFADDLHFLVWLNWFVSGSARNCIMLPDFFNTLFRGRRPVCFSFFVYLKGLNIIVDSEWMGWKRGNSTFLSNVDSDYVPNTILKHIHFFQWLVDIHELYSNFFMRTSMVRFAAYRFPFLYWWTASRERCSRKRTLFVQRSVNAVIVPAN
jgi:hypothetical protein